MADERIPDAMARIEAALGRIERAASERPAATASTTDNANAAELVARHEALRETVNASLADLDRLIGRLEG